MRQMRWMCVVAGLASLIVSGVALGQAAASSPAASAPTGPAGEVQATYARLKAFVIKAAEDMPGGEYQFKPTPDVRTFARVVNHISEAQLRSCGAANHTATNDLAKVPAETADKAAVVEALKASYVECDRAYGALTDANMSEMVQVGQGKRSRVGLMWGNVSHDNEQYATLALYMRLKGLVPPSSEK